MVAWQFTFLKIYPKKPILETMIFILKECYPIERQVTTKNCVYTIKGKTKAKKKIKKHTQNLG